MAYLLLGAAVVGLAAWLCRNLPQKIRAALLLDSMMGAAADHAGHFDGSDDDPHLAELASMGSDTLHREPLGVFASGKLLGHPQRAIDD